MTAETEVVFLRVPTHLKSELVKLAEARGLSLNAECLAALSGHVAQCLILGERLARARGEAETVASGEAAR